MTYQASVSTDDRINRRPDNRCLGQTQGKHPQDVQLVVGDLFIQRLENRLEPLCPVRRDLSQCTRLILRGQRREIADAFRCEALAGPDAAAEVLHDGAAGDAEEILERFDGVAGGKEFTYLLCAAPGWRPASATGRVRLPGAFAEPFCDAVSPDFRQKVVAVLREPAPAHAWIARKLAGDCGK